MRWRVLLVVLLCVLSGCSSSPPPPDPEVEIDAALKAVATLAAPVDDRRLTDTLAKAGRPLPDNATIDTNTFPYPVAAGRKSPDGYPIYLLTCSTVTKTCVDVEGNPLGSIEEVADRMTPIRNADVLNATFRCNLVCLDKQGNLVGSVSPAMQAYLLSLKHISATTP